MNTRRTAARRLDEEIANVGVSPQGNQVPPLEEGANDDKALVDRPPFTDGVINADLFKWPKPLLPKCKPLLLKLKP